MKLTCFFLTLGVLAFSITGFTQSKTLKSVRVTDLDSPYTEIAFAENGNDEEEDYTLDSLVKITDKKGQVIKLDEIKEGSIVTVDFIERDDQKIVTGIKLLTVADKGKVEHKALFDGFADNIAIIGGRKVKLAENGRIKGKGKEVFKGFDDPLLKKGCKMKVDGYLQQDGIIYAKEVVATDNPRTEDDARLLSFITTHFNGEGIQKFSNGTGNASGSNTAASGKQYSKGTVKVGEMTYTLVDDIKLQGYVNDIGFKLLPEYINEEEWQKTNPDVFFEFYLIEDPTPNAFALPNGKVFVHTGLLNVAENEAQLAFVMSHEISHVLYKHGTSRFVRRENNKKVSTTINKGLGAAKGIFKAVTGVGIAKQTTAETAATASAVVGGSSLTRTAVTVAAVAGKTILEKLGSDELSNLHKNGHEKEADKVALYYTQYAGYDIREVPKFWKNMMKINSDPTFIKNLGSSLKKSASDNLSHNSYVDLGTQALTVGMETVLNTAAKTIYISHPLSKKRWSTSYSALSSTYQSDNFAQSIVGKEEYQDYLRRLIK